MNTKNFVSKGFTASGFLNLTPREAYFEANQNDAIIIDVREPEMIGYKKFGVPVVQYIPFSKFEEFLSKIPTDKPLIIADSVGLRSHSTMLLLLAKGFRNIANLAGGIVEWERDGLPLEIDNTERLDGSCVCQLKPRSKNNKP